MNLIYCKKFNIIPQLIIGVGVLLASAFLFSFIAQAQTDDAAIQAAIQDLSSATGQSITSEDQAMDICNKEQYFDVCADIGKEHDLYTPEEEKQVDAFLGEIKGKILEDIKSCPDEECLIKVANELAKKIKVKNPTLATDFKLTSTIIEEKSAVVEAAKEAGIDFRDCESMDPDTAPVDLLRKCAKLAKDSRVQRYIPEERRALAEQFEDSATVKLREALSAGRYQCGDNTLEGCGKYCLNPTASGTTGIPPVCAQIASEIFGEEGVKNLEAAHQQVGQVKNYYSKKFILTLPDGRELVGEGQIRNACDQAFSGRKLDVARACGAFAVQNGFASQADVDKGLKLMESFTNKGQDVNFDECLANPSACRDFIPEDERERFDAGSQIFQIMKEEIGFEPFQCERGSADQTIGTKCSEGAKKALVRIESLGLADKSQEARFIIEDIRRHVSQGDEFNSRKDEFRQTFTQEGGPGGCRSEAECFNYCSDPTHGPECIAFGAKQGISGFRGEEAVQKFQEYNQNIQRPGFISDEYRPYPPGGQYPQFPGQGPYPGFQPPGQGGFPPGQVPGFPPPGTIPYPPPFPGGPGPVGPSPECFAAIQSGDFVKAKTFCYVPPPTQPFPSAPICPASPYIECPAGQYRESYRNDNGCWIDGPCKPAPTYTQFPIYTQNPGDPNSCPPFSHSKWDKNGKRYCRLNEMPSCQYDYPSYLERGNYSPGNCPTEEGGPYPTYSPGGKPQCSDGLDNDSDGKTDYPADVSCYGSDDWDEYYPIAGETFTPPPPCPAGQWWDYTYNKCTSAPACVTGYYWDSAANMCKPNGPPGPTYSPYPTYTYTPYPTTTGGAGGMYSCFYPNATKNGASVGYTVWCEKDYFNCHEGSKSGSSISLDGVSLGAPSSCESGYQGQSCNNNGFCDSNETISSCPSDCKSPTYSPYPSYSPTPSPANCPSGYHYHGESGGFCMNDREDYSSKCYNSAGTSTISCPIQVQPSYSPAPSCLAGQWWDYTQSKCTSTTSCGSGYYWDDVNKVCKPTGGTYSPGPSSSSCSQSLINLLGSDCHWMYSDSSGRAIYCDGPMSKSAKEGDSTTMSGCSSGGGTYSPYPTYSSSYTPPPSCPSGQYWDSAANSCKLNTSYGGCTGTTQSSCTSVSNCYWNSSSNYCYYQSTSPGTTTTYTPPPSCPSGQWWDYSRNSCVSSSTTYTPYPSCSSGQWWDSSTGSCKSTSSTGYCGNYVCDSGESSSSCPGDCGGGGSTYSPYPTYSSTYTPPPSCPSGQWWDSSTSSCQGSTATYTPYPTYESTYTPPPAESYSPPPAYSSPPPTSSIYNSYMVAHCQQLGRLWNGSVCRANGLFARFYEYYFANTLKAFRLIK